jgi:hypothetical protein
VENKKQNRNECYMAPRMVLLRTPRAIMSTLIHAAREIVDPAATMRNASDALSGAVRACQRVKFRKRLLFLVFLKRGC